MNRDQHEAFGLVELLFATAVLAILLGLALPSFSRFQESKRQQATRDLLISHIQQTRAQAIVGGRPLQLCGSSDGAVCDGDWGRYWLITSMSEPPVILRQQPAPSKKLCWAGFSGGDSIRFHPNGTSWVSNGAFSVCNADGPHWRLVLNRQGRLRLQNSDSSTCC